MQTFVHQVGEMETAEKRHPFDHRLSRDESVKGVTTQFNAIGTSTMARTQVIDWHSSTPQTLTRSADLCHLFDSAIPGHRHVRRMPVVIVPDRKQAKQAYRKRREVTARRQNTILRLLRHVANEHSETI